MSVSNGLLHKTSRAPARSHRMTTTPPIRLRLGNRTDSFEYDISASLADKLGTEIVGGIYPPGSLLPNESAMRARFSVSRTALREAYSVLAAKGLIVARPKVGTRVRPKSDWNMLDPRVLTWLLQAAPTKDFVDDLFALRQMIEPVAAAHAAKRPTRAVIKRIFAAYADMERYKDGAGDLIAADLRFHVAILEATGNRFVGALVGLIHAALLATFRLSWEGAARIQDNRLHQHRAIAEAIRNRQPEEARQRMTELLRDSVNDGRRALRRRKPVNPRTARPRRHSRSSER